MKRKSKKAAWALILMLCMGLTAGCSGKTEEPAEPIPAPVENVEEASERGGTLILKVNPEIAVEYDENGKVTAVYGRNEDGKKIVENYRDYAGKECHEAVEELVGLINEAGYFVEEVEGESRKITIEIETGSILPEEDFLDEIVTGVQTYVQDMQVEGPGADDVDIYDPEYGAEAYEVVIPPKDKEPAPETSTGENTDGSTPTEGGSGAENTATGSDGADAGSAVPGGETGNPPAVNANPPVNAASPYTDYETPYTEPSSSHTNYETPYTEPAASPSTDYETPYTEPASPYTDHETPYTDDHHESHYGDSGYSHYH